MATTILNVTNGDDDVITVASPCCGAVHSSQISIAQVSHWGVRQVEVSVPGVRLVLSPASADKLRMWLAKWVADTSGCPLD